MNILAIIPARGGSTRLKLKNIYPIWGKPMIHWAIEACKNSKYNIKVCVSTENLKIKETVNDMGVEIHNRNPKIADNKTYKQVVIREAAKWYESKFGKQDIFISLQANSPRIKSHHIDEGIDALLKYDRDEVFSVDKNLMQNAAFRVFKGDYVYQQDLSTNCGVVVNSLEDIHTLNDIKNILK
jgi:CMP-N-acetylneuraminic acid synthetase